MTPTTKTKASTKVLAVVMSACLLMLGVPLIGAAPADADTQTQAETPATANLAQVTSTDGTTTEYATLQEAVNAAQSGDTVALLADQSLPAQSSGSALDITDKDLTLDGQGHTLTVAGRGVYLTGGQTAQTTRNFVIKNLTITNPDAYGRVLSLRDGYKTLTVENTSLVTTGAGNTQVFTVGANTPQTTDITFDGCTLTASQAGYGIITFNPVDLTISNTKISGYAALYMKGVDYSAGSSNSKVNITNGSVLTSAGIAGPTNEFGTIVFQNCDNVDVNVTNSTIDVQAASGEPATPHSAIMYSLYADQQNGLAKDNTITFGEGSKVTTNNENASLSDDNGETNTINAADGTFAIAGPLFRGDQNAGTELNVTGGKWNKDVAPYIPADYSATDTDDGTDTPIVVTKKSDEKPINPDTPDKPDTPDTPDKPDTPGTTTPDTPGHEPGQHTGDHEQGIDDEPGTTPDQNKTDDNATAGDKTDQPSNDQTEKNATDEQVAGENNKATENQTNADQQTDTAKATSGTKAHGATVQTGDAQTDSMLALTGVAAAAALVAGASLIHRKRSARS